MIDLDQKDWIPICCVRDNEICFSPEYMSLTADIGWERRKFASQLISHWIPECEHLLDYFGPEDTDEDWYTGIDGKPMDVGELIPETWSVRGCPVNGLEPEWHRDLFRAKLVSIKLPKKLITEYIEILTKEKRNVR